VSSLSLLNFFIELIDNNGYKQVHNEECRQENIDDENNGHTQVLHILHPLVNSDTIDGIEHVVGPHFECRDLEECNHTV